MRDQFNAVCGALLQETKILVFVIAAFTIVFTVRQAHAADEKDAFYYNRLLGLGINLGNALDAPVEGAWGITLKPQYFQVIKDAGFNSVLDWAIDQALSRSLVAVIDVQHFEEMSRSPLDSLERLVHIWAQIAQHYRGYSDRLYFELLNEPGDQLTDKRWQEIALVLLRIVRDSNPTRIVVIGPASLNAE
jgi:endoglucanase